MKTKGDKMKYYTEQSTMKTLMDKWYSNVFTTNQ